MPYPHFEREIDYFGVGTRQCRVLSLACKLLQTFGI